MGLAASSVLQIGGIAHWVAPALPAPGAAIRPFGGACGALPCPTPTVGPSRIQQLLPI